MVPRAMTFGAMVAAVFAGWMWIVAGRASESRAYNGETTSAGYEFSFRDLIVSWHGSEREPISARK